MTRASSQRVDPDPVAGSTTGVGRATARPTRPGRSSRLRTRLELTLLLGPPLALFITFVFLPICVAAYYGFFRWTGFSPLRNIGFANYRRAFRDPVFQHAIVHNLIIAGLSLCIQLPLIVWLAFLLHRRMRGRRVLRLVVFAPYVLAEATAAVIWSLMLQRDGFISQLFRWLGLGSWVQDWLANQRTILYALFVVLTWKYIGLGIILLLAGLQGIPEELREAAVLDGASAWEVSRYVLIPLLGPTIRIWVFLSMIGSLQLFDIPWIMTNLGPDNSSATMASYLIEFGFQRYQFGYGAAVAVILFLICFLFALLYQRFALRRDTQGALTRMVG